MYSESPQYPLTNSALSRQIQRSLRVEITQIWAPIPFDHDAFIDPTSVLEEATEEEEEEVECVCYASVAVTQSQPGERICLSLDENIEDFPCNEPEKADRLLASVINRLGDAMLSRLIPLAELESGYQSPLC